MFNLVFKWLIDSKARNYYQSEIEDAIEVITKYGLWDRMNPMENGGLIQCDDPDEENHKARIFLGKNCYFCKAKDDKMIVDIFHKDIHIHASLSETEKIYSVRIKKREDVWTFDIESDDSRFDPSHPVNETYEVYVWYLVPILDITKVDGYVYKHGSWDKQVYKEMEEFFESIDAETQNSRFNVNYKMKNKKQ